MKRNIFLFLLIFWLLYGVSLVLFQLPRKGAGTAYYTHIDSNPRFYNTLNLHFKPYCVSVDSVSDVWTHRERQGAWLVFIQSLHWQAALWLLLGSDSLFSQGPSASLIQTLQSHLHCSCCEQRDHLQSFLTYGKWKTTDPVMDETQDMWRTHAIFVPCVELWGFDLKFI